MVVAVVVAPVAIVVVVSVPVPMPVPVDVSIIVVVVAVVDGARAHDVVHAAAASAVQSVVPSIGSCLATRPLDRVTVLCHLLGLTLTSLRLGHFPGCNHLVISAEGRSRECA